MRVRSSHHEFVVLLEEQKASNDAEKRTKEKRENRNKETISLHVKIVKMLRKVSHIINEKNFYPCTNI